MSVVLDYFIHSVESQMRADNELYGLLWSLKFV